MHQKETILSHWECDPAQGQLSNEPNVSLRGDDQAHTGFSFTFEAVRKNIFRTTFTSESHPLPPHPSSAKIATDLTGTSVLVTSSDKAKEIQIGEVRATVDWNSNPHVSISLANDPSGQALHSDLPGRSYVADGTGVAHYSRYKRDSLYIGLGEKAAPMNLSGRRFQLAATDSFGYDVYRTDPLYKHIPLLINATPNGCVALFSASQARGEYTVGCEMDGMWGFYKAYRQSYGGLEEYILVGRTLKDIVKAYADLVGYPLLVPRWAFGYLAGGMKYSMLDEPRASNALLDLARKLKHHDIPCSAYQMASGYTISEIPPKTRNVFTWNYHRFPDPERFISQFRQQGLRLVANVKPYILASHPEYEKLKATNGLFQDPSTNTTAVTHLWSAGGGESDVGGHIDFTSEAGFKWWYEGVKKLRKQGIEGIWNDNNEYTITDDNWECGLDNQLLQVPQTHEKSRQVGVWGRSLHTELHGRASHDALLDASPNERPFVLTRSATAGTMRYACSTWSGDNVTSWAGMKGANALSLTAGMCLMQCYGHDIGGFEGPQPSPELLVRWVQQGIYSPRFAINCFKTGSDNNVGEVIEPWMYPSVTPLIRKAIKRRYAMIPYLYSLMLEGHLESTPPQRWTGWGYESDSEVWTPEIMDGESQYWLGESLLIGGVFQPGAREGRVYLPKASEDDEGYINLNAPYQYLAGGQWATLDAEWHGSGIPVLGRVGKGLPIGKDAQVLSAGEVQNVASLPLDDYRGIEIFPPQGSSNGKWFDTTWHEDDGVSIVEKNKISTFTITYSTTEEDIKVKFFRQEESGFIAPWADLDIILPVGDQRQVIAADNRKMEQPILDEKGRRHFQLH
ncbi:unnamed protein product [Clonostachys byssicola]|uniref:alpha-glucosidase n=1 Tax=Clonostachys byssicola TaxID=160290 RepID=A0A9N9Y6A4_9HYPO|nr:unnamed protein product [Clonostachys byssicola]